MHDSGNGFSPAPLARVFHHMPGPKTTLERDAKDFPWIRITSRAVSGERPAIYMTADRCFEMEEAVLRGTSPVLVACEYKVCCRA